MPLAPGYVVVFQDVRGRYRSDGVFDPYRQEGKDGYDTIAWVAGLPYCDGQVGLTGLSYPAAVQWLAAVESPPQLKAMAPAMTFSNGRSFVYFGGAFDLSWLPWFYSSIAPDVRRRLGLPGPRSDAEAEKAWTANGEAWLRHLPLGTHPALAGVAPAFFEWLDHPDDGPYWDYLRIESRYDRVRIPVLNLSGWHDEGYSPNGAAHNFMGTRQWGGRLVIGPWTHGTPTPKKTRVGAIDFGKDAGLDYFALLLRFFDRWLKGVPNGIDREPPVRIFVMGDNVWRDETEWPLARARPTAYYLRASGRLASDPPSEPEASDGYVYDPADPVVDPHEGRLGPFDQSPLQARRDVLVYKSEPLARDLEVSGPIEIELWASSSARDTDFVARLLDVHPDGKAYNLMSPTLEVLRRALPKRRGPPGAARAGPAGEAPARERRHRERLQGRPPHRPAGDELAAPASRPQPEHRRGDREGRANATGGPADLPRRRAPVPHRASRRPALTLSESTACGSCNGGRRSAGRSSGSPRAGRGSRAGRRAAPSCSRRSSR